MSNFNNILSVIAVMASGLLCAQTAENIDYKRLRERVESMVKQPIDPRINIAAGGIPQALQNDWIITFDDVARYIEFRTNDETANIGDIRLTFQNLLSIKDELVKAIAQKILSPQGHARQLLDQVTTMVQDKMYKIKNMPVTGLGQQLDVWYILDKLTVFTTNLFNRILLDLQKIPGTRG